MSAQQQFPRPVVDVSGQLVLVTGAASGIGLAVTERLAELGARVIGIDQNQDGLRALADSGLTADTLALDITDAANTQQQIAALLQRESQVHALVNCAGITGETGKPSAEIPIQDFNRVLSVNVSGAFSLSTALLPHMTSKGYGRILHVASISGKDGNAGMVSYSTSKAALIGMVKAMGKEYATSGVTVNAIAPAVIATPMVAAMPQHQVQYMVDKIPMGRLGSLDEIANAIAWAISPAASFTTGFTFDLSGGRAVY